MYTRPAVRAVIRFAIIASVFLLGTTFGAHDADARRGGKVRSSHSHSKPHDSTKHHDGSESTTRKSGDGEEGSGVSSGMSHVPGVRVRSREASRETGDTKTDADTTAHRSMSPMLSSGSGSATKSAIDVTGCGVGMICTVCLAGCDGPVNEIVDAQVRTPEPKVRQ